MGFSDKMNREIMDNTKDIISGGVIGRVLRYHPPKGNAPEKEGSDKKAGRCFCSRHNGQRMEMFERHTVDVEIVTERQKTEWKAVPCFMYAQGIIDHGFKENDKVYIQFINNDLSHPVAIAYYRPPNKLDNFWNSLKYSMANFVQEYVVDAINPESLVSSSQATGDEEIIASEDLSNVETPEPATISESTKNVMTASTTPPKVTSTKERA